MLALHLSTLSFAAVASFVPGLSSTQGRPGARTQQWFRQQEALWPIATAEEYPRFWKCSWSGDLYCKPGPDDDWEEDSSGDDSWEEGDDAFDEDA